MGSKAHPDGQRLHPATLLFELWRSIATALPLALLFLVRKDTEMFLIGILVVAVPTMAFRTIRYVRVRWRIDGDRFLIREGALFQTKKDIPRQRLQDLSLVQGIVHRVLGVAEVQCETAGGTTPEARLRVISLADVKRLQAWLAAEDTTRGQDLERGTSEASSAEPTPTETLPLETRPLETRPLETTPLAEAPAKTAPPEEALLLRVPMSHLLLLGLVAHRGWLVVGAAIGLIIEHDLADPLWRLLALDRLHEDAAARGTPMLVLAVVVVLVVGLVLLSLASVAWTAVRFGGFTLSTRGDVFRLRFGLLTRVAATVPRDRIQAVIVEASWLHRLSGFVSIGVQTASQHTTQSRDKDWTAITQRRMVPIIPRDEAPRLLRALGVDGDFELLGWRPLHPRALRRVVVRRILSTALLVAGAWIFASPTAAIATAFLLPPLIVHARAEVPRRRYARNKRLVAWQRGVLTRTTTLVRDDRIQSVGTASTPFDRRHGQATLRVDVAGGQAAALSIAYLPASEAVETRESLAARTSR